MKLSKEKKIGAIIIILIVVFSAGGAVTILGIGQNIEGTYNDNVASQLPANAKADQYTVEISSNTQWVAYIIVDGQNIQKYGANNDTIDLGHVEKYASITVEQPGVGTTYVSLVNPNGTVIDTDNTNLAETNTLFFYLKV